MRLLLGIVALFVSGCGGMPWSSDNLPTGEDLQVWITETAVSELAANCAAFAGNEVVVFSERLGDPCDWGQQVMAELVVDCPVEPAAKGGVQDVLDAAFAFSCAFAASEFDRKGNSIELDSVTDGGFTVRARLRRGVQ